MTFKTISTKIIHQSPWRDYKHDVFQLSEDEEGDYFYCESNGAAMVIPILLDGRLVLVRQYRYLFNKSGIEFPCGGLRQGERSSEAAARELLEETGFQAKELIKITDYEPANSFCKNKISLYVGSDLNQVDSPHPEKGEILEPIYRRVDEFEEMVKNGEIEDGQTLAAWAVARDYIKSLSNI
ncbi:MAG: NUDIX hydrolase [bacterium]